MLPAQRPISPPVIVVVEDDHDVRVALRELLESEGYVVHSAADGHSAIELLESFDAATRPQLLIVDLRMPIMDGWSLLEYVRQRPELATIPVAVQSGDEESTLPDGVSFVLRKPVEVDALLAAVRHYCGAP